MRFGHIVNYDIKIAFYNYDLIAQLQLSSSFNLLYKQTHETHTSNIN